MLSIYDALGANHCTLTAVCAATGLSREAALAGLHDLLNVRQGQAEGVLVEAIRNRARAVLKTAAIWPATANDFATQDHDR